MRWLITVAGTVIACVAGLAGIGYSTHNTHVVQVRIDLSASPDTVARLLADLDGWADWNHSIDAIEALDERPEIRDVDGDLGFLRLGPDPQAPEGSVTYRLERRWYSGKWSFDVEQLDGGSRVTFTEQARIENLVIRGLTVVRNQSNDLAAFLTGLAGHFGEEAAPQSLS